MIKFEPMTEQDFAAFIRKSIPEYAYDQMRAGNWTANEAAGRARAEFQQMLPEGPQTSNAYLRVILDEQGHKAGMLWYFVDENRSRKTAFLIDFFLFPEARHKGYESQVFELFESEARGLGVERVELQVFTHKNEEIKLYRENGFQEISVFFARDLTQQDKA
ncbi:MAG: GNAT family N-acetyltransferase [Chloroflexi bacterium]|nr:GNAT family N-acetyltransferase [Chloroflexota bacterium]